MPATIVEAQRLLTRMLVVMRLVAPDTATPNAAKPRAGRAAVRRTPIGTICLPRTTRRGRAYRELWQKVRESE